MKVYEALAKAFKAEGTSDVFGMMGDANQYWIKACDQLGINVYEVRHEGAGLSMAEGLSRSNMWSNGEGATPGVCTTTAGPGCAQLATGMLVASRARTPLVAFCGDAPWGDEEHNYRLNQERFAAALEAGFVRVATPESAYEAVQRAFYLAKLESRPILLSAPMDIQSKEFPHGDDEYVPSAALFGTSRIAPDPAQIERAADIIAKAERPVIIVGRGAKWSGAQDAILRLADRVGAIIATSLLAKTWLADLDEFHVGISGLFATRTAMELFADADCVIAAGATLNAYTTEHGYLFPNAKIVQLDTKRQVVMGDGRAADCYIQTDAKLGLEALESALEARSVHQSGFRTPEVKERLGSAFDDPKAYDIAPGLVDPREVCLVMDELLPANVGLSTGNGHHATIECMLFQKARPLYLNNHHFSCIGQAVTTAIGASIAGKSAPMVAMEGDASFMMHLGEFDTAVRYNLPVLVAVMNDEGLAAEFKKAEKTGVPAELSYIPSPNLAMIGEGLGAHGREIRSIDALRSAVAEFVAKPGPMLLDVRMDRQVISVQVRRSTFGEEI